MYRLIPTPTIRIITVLSLALLIFLIFRLVKNIREKRWGRIAAFVISTVLVFGLIFLYGEYLLYKQKPKDLAFVEEVIKPAVLFTRKFYEENGVLPAEEDFAHAGLKCAGRVYIYTEGKKFQNKDYKDFKKEIVIPEGHYIIAIWRGEWDELYYSRCALIYSNVGEIYFP